MNCRCQWCEVLIPPTTPAIGGRKAWNEQQFARQIQSATPGKATLPASPEPGFRGSTSVGLFAGFSSPSPFHTYGGRLEDQRCYNAATIGHGPPLMSLAFRRQRRVASARRAFGDS